MEFLDPTLTLPLPGEGIVHQHHIMNAGRLDWIGLRPTHKQAVISVKSAEAIVGLGLAGDHRCEKTPGSARQVTLISSEYIQKIAEKINQKIIDPALLRRNLVISGMNMDALRYQQIKIGDVVLETSALCHPCSRMDQALGKGTTKAMMGLGGLCAKILQGGVISVGDKVELLLVPPLATTASMQSLPGEGIKKVCLT